jgi:hypothetical protein
MQYLEDLTRYLFINREGIFSDNVPNYVALYMIHAYSGVVLSLLLFPWREGWRWGNKPPRSLHAKRIQFTTKNSWGILPQQFVETQQNIGYKQTILGIQREYIGFGIWEMGERKNINGIYNGVENYQWIQMERKLSMFLGKKNINVLGGGEIGRKISMFLGKKYQCHSRPGDFKLDAKRGARRTKLE